MIKNNQIAIRIHRWALALTLALSLIAARPPVAARAATIIVNTAVDEQDGSCSDGDCSLRDAIALAAGGDTITFAGDYTIYLDDQLLVEKVLTVDGSGHTVTVSGDSGGDGTPNTRVFFIGSGIVTLTHLSIVDGIAAKGGGIYVYSSGRLFAQNCFIAGNSTLDYPNTGGGGILNEGEATVINSTLTGNTGGGYGGGIYSQGPLTVTNSAIIGNSSSYRGGGIYISHDLLNLHNTLIADNSGGDCHLDPVGAGVAENDHNLIESSGASACDLVNGEGGSLIGVDPLLGALGDYGGNTQTFALLPGSPAIDAGNDATCLPADQRGIARPQSAHCDIGAFESQGFTLTVAAGDGQSAPIQTLFPQPLSLAVAAAGAGEPVDGGQVVFTGPDSGAGISPSVYTVTINGGLASQAVWANATAGSYSVSADARGRMGSAAGFALTNFVAVTHTLTIAIAGEGSGVVTPTVGAHVYVSGTLVALGATPNPGSSFAGWSGAGCAAGQVTLDADRVCTATFTLAEEQYFIYLPLVVRQ